MMEETFYLAHLYGAIFIILGVLETALEVPDIG